MQAFLGLLHMSCVLRDIFPSLFLYLGVNEFFAFIALLSVSYYVSKCIICFSREEGIKIEGPDVSFSASFIICKTP